ncbi:MAG TPA: FAD-dependent oxidoreductase [Solirubrobacterales bacterium]|nr:FAD-dependent oxidoreductase [Solirubrobacterales bacterium]
MSISADLLVVGGGVAGTAAAAHAADTGARVVVVEKGDHLGGSGALSAGILWTAPDYETLHRICPHGDPELGRILVDGFDAAVDAAREAGVEVSERWQGQMGFGIAHRIDIHTLLDIWRERIESAGGTVLFETAARELLADGGAVTGAAVSGPDGDQRIDAAATLLATGGFQGDPERVRALIGPGAEELIVRSNPRSTGDGLRMGLAAGGALSGSLDSFYGHLLPDPIDDLEPEDFLPLTQYHSHACVLVNRFGRRFVDESRGDEVSNQFTLRQPGGRAILLCDEAVRGEFAVGPPYPHGQVVDRFAVAAEAGGRIARADTIDALVAEVEGWDVNGPALRETLARYEAAAAGDRGVTLDAPLPAEPHPLREPPFHALEVQPSITFTFGGLRTDSEGRALDAGGSPVPGLYAAGADMGGIQDTGYVGGLVLGLVFGPRVADAAVTRDRGRDTNQEVGASD